MPWLSKKMMASATPPPQVRKRKAEEEEKEQMDVGQGERPDKFLAKLQAFNELREVSANTSTTSSKKTNSNSRRASTDPPKWRPGRASTTTPTPITSATNFTPTRIREVAVHSKKIEEVRLWIQSKIEVERGEKTLLVSGPCGCGKATTIRMLCQEMDVEVLEYEDTSEFEVDSFGGIYEKTPAVTFTEFVRNADLCLIMAVAEEPASRLLLIKELPNAFYRYPHLFRDLLTKFTHSTRCMVVFVISNYESSWEMNPVRLFPQVEVIDRMQMAHIKFNPVAPTLMNKAVKRALILMGAGESATNKELLQEIASAADGDIRKALNTIKFYHHRHQQQRLVAVATAEKNRKGEGSAVALPVRGGGRAEIFHSIGKLMYAKRSIPTWDRDDPWAINERRLKPKVYHKHSRSSPPWNDTDELISALSSNSPQLLAEYVFEHEPNFIRSMRGLLRTTANLCEFDALMGEVDVSMKEMMGRYQMEVVVRSTTFHNYKSGGPRRKGLYTFDKPKVRANRFWRPTKHRALHQDARVVYAGRVPTIRAALSGYC